MTHRGRSSGPTARHAPIAGPWSPAELLVRMGRGDRLAFAHLYEQLAGRVHTYVLRLLRDASLAEDVTQEVFLEVWCHAARYDPSRGPAIAWVLSIARHRAIGRVRATQARSDRELGSGGPDVTTAEDPVATEVEARLDRRTVRRSLHTLTALQRQAVVLRYYHGHTSAEIADILGIPHGTAKTRIRDGLLRLRSTMDGLDDGVGSSPS